MELAEIASILGSAKREGRGFRCLCPAHNDRSPSLSLSQSATGKLLVRCWSGCEPAEILKAINQLTGLKMQPPVINDRLPPERSTRPIDQSTPAWVLKLWQEAISIQNDDLAARYLHARGIPLEKFPGSLRFHPRCKVSDVPGVTHLAALLARFDDPDGNLSTVHRIYLQEPGRKADIPRQKRICSSPTRGGAIKLAPATQQLGIAEGLETGLACMIDTNIPVWAAYSSSLLPSVVVPASVQEVFIFADNDHSGAGQKAAFALQDRLLAEGRVAKTLIPPVAGRDWLDILNE